MKTRLLSIAGALVGFVLFSPFQAAAALVQFDISGQGSGTLNGNAWSAPFDISMVGDNSTVTVLPGFPNTNSNQIAPLISANIAIHGVGVMTLLIDTRLGLNGFYDVMFFSRDFSGSGGQSDLFDFYLTLADAAAFNFQPAYGPVVGTDVFALNQFTDISTTLGLLSLNQSSNVLFSTLEIVDTTPIPATLPLFATGLGALGLLGWRRKRKI